MLTPLWRQNWKIVLMHAWIDGLEFCPVLQRGPLHALSWSHHYSSSCGLGRIFRNKSLWQSFLLPSTWPAGPPCGFGTMGKGGGPWKSSRSDEHGRYMSHWPNTKPFSLPPSTQFNYYSRISRAGREELECFHMLTVPTPPGFAYLSDIILLHDSGATSIWHFTPTEYLVIAGLPFLAAACDTVISVASIDPQMCSNGQGVPVQFPFGIHLEFSDISLIKIASGSSLDNVASLIAYIWPP